MTSVTFRYPPVSEVVLAVQFSEAVVDLEVLASFAASVKEEFPHREQHPPLPPVIEDFGIPTGPTFQFQIAPPFELPRSWFVSDDGSRVIQLQGDRLILNWRKSPPDASYPRYNKLRPILDKQLDTLGGLLREAGKPEPTINFCEVTYVNQIDVPGSEPGPSHPDLAEVLRFMLPIAKCSFKFLPSKAEDQNVRTRVRIPGRRDLNQPGGRLLLSCDPVFRLENQRPIFLLNLSAHVLPEEPSLDSAWEALDIGHEWVVEGFRDVTTKRMHAAWEEIEEGERLD